MIATLPRTIVLVASLIAGLGGCAGRTYYSDVPEPVAPVARPAAPTQAGGYTVKSGDTLYSISFSLGTDWRDLAALNGISPPYTIYPGQVLRTGQGAPSIASPGASMPAATPTGARTIAAPDAGAPLVTGSSPAPVVTTTPGSGSTSPSAATTPGSGSTNPSAATAPRVTAPAPSATPTVSTPATAAATARPQPPPRPGAWQWPGAGRLLRGFSGGAQPHKGIDLDGRPGDPVLAANSGTVVYAGNGVRGYGNLLIVKHDATFLSAYAHNSRLLVKEGDVVQGGQKIAEVGDSGTDRVKLHFEVRKQGNPVDPMTILPRR